MVSEALLCHRPHDCVIKLQMSHRKPHGMQVRLCYQNQHRFLRVILDLISFHFLVEKGIVKLFMIKFGTKILYHHCHSVSMLPLVKNLILIKNQIFKYWYI